MEVHGSYVYLPLRSSLLFKLLPEVVDALREVDLDPPIVDQNVVHLEVGFLTGRIAEKRGNRSLE